MKIQLQVLTWNSEKVLPTFLDAIKKLQPKPFRILVIDNNSKDATRSLLQKEQGIETILLDNNTGFTGGHNRGFARALDSDAILCVNPDVALVPETLRIFETIASSNSRIGSIGGKLLRPPVLTIGSKMSIVDTAGIKRHLSFKFTDIGSGEPDTKELARDRIVFANSGACLFLPTSVCRTISISANKDNLEVFDSRFFAYKEDIDLGWRLAKKGFTNINTGAVVGTHIRTLKKEIKHNKRSKQHLLLSYRNHLLLLSKHLSRSLLLKYGVFIGVYELSKFGYLFLHHPAITLQAIKEYHELKKPDENFHHHHCL